MVTIVKMSKDRNSTTLKELVSSLRSNEIELKENEPQRKGKFVALKGKTEKERAFQAEEEEESEEDFDEKDELSLLTKRFNQLYRKTQKKIIGFRRTSGCFESTSGKKKYYADKDVIYFECNESGHYKNE